MVRVVSSSEAASLEPVNDARTTTRLAPLSHRVVRRDAEDKPFLEGKVKPRLAAPLPVVRARSAADRSPSAAHVRAGRAAHVVHGEVLDVAGGWHFSATFKASGLMCSKRLLLRMLHFAVKRKRVESMYGCEISDAPAAPKSAATAGSTERKRPHWRRRCAELRPSQRARGLERACRDGKTPHETSLYVLYLKLGISSRLLIRMDF